MIGLDEALEQVRDEFRGFFFGGGGAATGPTGPGRPASRLPARPVDPVSPGAGLLPGGRAPALDEAVGFLWVTNQRPTAVEAPGLPPTSGPVAGVAGRAEAPPSPLRPTDPTPAVVPIFRERIEVSVAMFAAALTLEVARLAARDNAGERDDSPTCYHGAR